MRFRPEEAYWLAEPAAREAWAARQNGFLQEQGFGELELEGPRHLTMAASGGGAGDNAGGVQERLNALELMVKAIYQKLVGGDNEPAAGSESMSWIAGGTKTPDGRMIKTEADLMTSDELGFTSPLMGEDMPELDFDREPLESRLAYRQPRPGISRGIGLEADQELAAAQLRGADLDLAEV